MSKITIFKAELTFNSYCLFNNSGGMKQKEHLYILDRAEKGEYVVVSLGSGRGFLRRLADLGIYPGARFSVVSSGRGGGPIILSIKGSRIGIGRGMATRIIVKRM